MDTLEKRAELNKKRLNRNKCKGLLMGSKNVMHVYRMGTTLLRNCIYEQDFRGVMDCKLNMSRKCDATAKNANAILWYIKRHSVYNMRYDCSTVHCNDLKYCVSKIHFFPASLLLS